MSVAAFMAGAPDAHGRTHAGILAWDDARLEATHNYIQWLFPLPEPSRAVAGSPVLSEADIAAIRASGPAQAALAAATARMLAFYTRTSGWLEPHDHNQLRITRIIKSLRHLAGDDAADEFRNGMIAQARVRGGRVNADTLAFWSRA